MRATRRPSAPSHRPVQAHACSNQTLYRPARSDYIGFADHHPASPFPANRCGPRAAPAAPDMALRIFTAGDGTVWNVWNVVPTLARNDQKLTLGVGMTEGWLCFESGGVKKRVVPVPEGWEEWPDEELQTALASARDVPRNSFSGRFDDGEQGAGGR